METTENDGGVGDGLEQFFVASGLNGLLHNGAWRSCDKFIPNRFDQRIDYAIGCIDKAVGAGYMVIGDMDSVVQSITCHVFIDSHIKFLTCHRLNLIESYLRCELFGELNGVIGTCHGANQCLRKGLAQFIDAGNTFLRIEFVHCSIGWSKSRKLYRTGICVIEAVERGIEFTVLQHLDPFGERLILRQGCRNGAAFLADVGSFVLVGEVPKVLVARGEEGQYDG